MTPLTINDLILQLQTYYACGTYTREDVDAWRDEFEKCDGLFLASLFVAIRRIHSKTFKTLPDVAIAHKAYESACRIYDGEKGKTLQIGEAISDKERGEVCDGLRSLLVNLCKEKGVKE